MIDSVFFVTSETVSLIIVEKKWQSELFNSGPPDGNTLLQWSLVWAWRRRFFFFYGDSVSVY